MILMICFTSSWVFLFCPKPEDVVRCFYRQRCLKIHTLNHLLCLSPHNTSRGACVTSSKRITTFCANSASEWHGKAVSDVIFNSVSPWKLPHTGRPAYSCQFLWKCVNLCTCVWFQSCAKLSDTIKTNVFKIVCFSVQ